MSNSNTPSSTTSLLIPPYESFTPITQVHDCPSRGVAVVWAISDAVAQRAEWEWLDRRPACVSLVIVLPPPSAIQRALPLLRDANALRPRGVLPHRAVMNPEPVRLLLSSSPRDLAAMAVSHFTNQGLLRNQRIRGLVLRMFEFAPTIPSVSRLARKLYTSRRTLGRAFVAEGLPVPSHWLQLARLLWVSAIIQEKRGVPIFKAATQVGYPDGFTMSNQMKRLIGCRPSEVRANLGLSWILEEWISRERAAGQLYETIPYREVNDVDGWLRRYPMRRGV